MRMRHRSTACLTVLLPFSACVFRRVSRELLSCPCPCRHRVTFITVCFALILCLLPTIDASTISCYTCVSKNGTQPNCDDPYNPAATQYSKDCMVPKQGHLGKFPANYCVKIMGTNTNTGESLMIRTCVSDNMGEQCGLFKFEKEELRGCVLTCNHDGCNGATVLRSDGAGWNIFFLFVLISMSYF